MTSRRDASYLAPPARIRTCSFPAYGSYLGCVTAKRLIGPGMKDTRFWEPLVNQPVHAVPVESRPRAASGEHAA
jgi:hypothetical protein